MGKASRWFRAVLGLKKSEPPPPSSSSSSSNNTTTRSKEKRRWSFVKSYREKDSSTAPPPPSSSTKRGVPYSHHHGVDPASVAAAGVVVTSSTSTTEFYEDVDPNKHAIAVAAATAAVADAAVAAAHAAAEVVRLTSSGRCGKSGSNGNTNSSQQDHHPHRQEEASGGESVIGRRAKEVGEDEELAAVKIQAAFRGYLARRALKALRALVKLQALVRGHIERKRTAEWLHRMQALLRAQARARAGRAQISESSKSSGKSCHFHHPGPPTPEKFEHSIRTKSGKYEHSTMFKRTASKSNGREINDNDKAHLGFNWSDRRMDERSWDQRVPYARSGPMEDERSDKILEVDTGKSHLTPKRRNLFHSHHGLASDQYSQSFTTSKDSTTHHIVRSPSSGEVQSLSPMKFSHEVEEAFCTADNSPQFYSASSKGASGKRSPFTPTRSDGSRSFLSGFSDYPNYMSYTESSRAKVRSLSAPKQRPQYERSSSAKRCSVHSLGGEPRSSSAQRASALRASFTNKAYPGSGRLDRLGMPIGQRYY